MFWLWIILAVIGGAIAATAVIYWLFANACLKMW